MEPIVVARITGVVTLTGVILSNSKSRAVMEVKLDALARRVIAGESGNGDERKQRLGSYYSIVQRRVNEMLT
jgi:hypothetical protein